MEMDRVPLWRWDHDVVASLPNLSVARNGQVPMIGFYLDSPSRYTNVPAAKTLVAGSCARIGFGPLSYEFLGDHILVGRTSISGEARAFPWDSGSGARG